MDKEINERSAQSEIEELSARWDQISFRVQGSPFEDVSVVELAKNVGTRPWSRPGTKARGDRISRYIHFSFEELLEVEKLDLKLATLLLEICEALFLMEEEYSGMGSFEEVDKQAKQQRLRFVEEFGLNQDFPITLSNLDDDLSELCATEDVFTFVDLMEFLDRLSDKATIGGCYRELQNIFAHGDEKGLSQYFPFRPGYRGFHLPEALLFMLKHLSPAELDEVCGYCEDRMKRGFLAGKRAELPVFVEAKLLPQLFECLCYFARKQPQLLSNLHDEAYLGRELMHLDDRRIETVLHWLVQLSLGLFRPERFAGVACFDEEIQQLSLPRENEFVKELRQLLRRDEENASD